MGQSETRKIGQATGFILSGLSTLALSCGTVNSGGSKGSSRVQRACRQTLTTDEISAFQSAVRADMFNGASYSQETLIAIDICKDPNVIYPFECASCLTAVVDSIYKP